MTDPSSLETITGTKSFESRKRELRENLHSKLPADCILPKQILDDLPTDVTGIPESCGLLTSEEIRLTNLDATGVRDEIAQGRVTAVAVVTAFGRRAAIAQQLVCCLTDFFLQDGIRQAAELDDYYAKNGKTVGPLHGVPISIKDHISVQGQAVSNGFASGISIAKEDADIIKMLRKLGAVLYVKTNQPQTIMHLETHSVYGRTVNPHNRNLTPGGSSGGESSLIAMKGSCLGIGTLDSDGGGSIRNPAGNTGIFGFRPTTKTMPTDGYLFYMPGCDSFGISTGPMCSSLRDIDLFMAAIRGGRPETIDPTLYPQPWHVKVLERKLRVGIMRHDGVVTPQPPMLRALDTVARILRESDAVDVVDFAPYKQRFGYDNLRSLYFEDGGHNIRKALEVSGEQPLQLTKWLLDTELTSLHDVWQSWDTRRERDEYRKEYAEHWRASDLDVLLMPPFPGTACPHDTARYWGYTAVYNNLDYPGIVFPTGLVADPELDPKPERTDFINDPEGSDEYNHSIYEPELYKGAPIGLQLLAYRFDDLKLFAGLQVIQSILKAAQKQPSIDRGGMDPSPWSR